MSRNFGIAIVALCVALGVTSAAHAVILNLTGGDPGDGTPNGYQPLPVAVYAYGLTYSGATPTPANQTVQNVIFKPWLTGSASPDSGATASGVSGSFPASPTTIAGASANDTAMNNMLQNGWYGNPTMTFVISGLTTGRSYQIDALINANSNYNENFAFNGVPFPADSFTSTAHVSYDVVETVTAVANQITMTVSSSSYIVLNGFSVTTTPEPASLGILATGGVMLLRRRRA